ncbi:TonB-dependent receptor plug domain-containing protein [Olivibacter ginsenosidimutans]|uniref:TonB-dependent receptor plug domain-containing protein n=1 Tax=Olivibacter ginsenosidimutans TaxID=1176537 RepID=A0ABP9AMS4_9SPHI
MNYKFFFIGFLLFSTRLLLAQQIQPNSALEHVLGNLEKYQKEYPQEKVYLHLDKPYYTAGEDLWFKAYITVGNFNFLSAISKLLYVELINTADECVQSERLPVVAGQSMGDFKLPDTLREGSYRIRAYTNWMRNFDEGFFFDKTIVIGNSLTSSLVTSSKFTFIVDDKQKRIGRETIKIHDLNGNPITEKLVNYVVTQKGKVIAKGKTALDGQGAISLEFPVKDDLAAEGGNIQLTIDQGGRSPVVKVIPIPKTNLRPVVKFYPEGGVLLAETFNKVGFQAIGTSGRGVPIRGYVESDGQQVNTFSSDSSGLGNFSFVPEAGEPYEAVVDFGGGDTVRMMLPQVSRTGYALAVNNAIENMIWVLVTGAVKQGRNPLSVVAQHDGTVFYALKSALKEGAATVGIPRKQLPSGVVDLLLLDEQEHLLAHRSIFNFKETDLLPLQVSASKNAYGRREKVDLTLLAKGLHDSLRVGCFSMAVTQTGKVPDSLLEDANIVSTLLLGDQVKTYLEKPGYYFNTKISNAKRMRQLDDFMLTQHLDSAFWPRVMSSSFPGIRYPAEKDLRISGTITRRKGEAVDGAKVTVITPQNILAVLDTVTGPDGRFAFDQLIFADSVKFVVQARDAKGKKNVEIHLDSVPKHPIGVNKNWPDAVADANLSLGNYLAIAQKNLGELQKFGLLQRSIQLDEVTVTAKKEEPAKYSSNLNGPGNADQVLSGDDPFFGSCSSLDQCLNGRLTGVFFQNGVPYSTRSPNQPMQVVLDGMYMDAEALSTIAPMDVASVEVLRSIGNTAIYGSYGGGGVLIITTRRGDQPRKYNTDMYTPGITSFSPQGLYEARTFHSPDYSAGEEKPGMKDLRTTIYWNPELVTDQNGEANVSFYTADEPGMYQIVVEGIDTEGHVGRSVSYINVK